MDKLIFGHSWEAIQRGQRGGNLHETIKPRDGDYGADPMGNGMFRMVPSGDIVDFAERCKRLA
jgi:hypothetical protein